MEGIMVSIDRFVEGILPPYDDTINKLMDHKTVVLAAVVTGSTINAPGKLSNWANESRLFKFMYVFTIMYEFTGKKAASAAVVTLMTLLVYDLLRDGPTDPYLPFFSTVPASDEVTKS